MNTGLASGGQKYMKYTIKPLKKKYVTTELLETLQHLSSSTVVDVPAARKQLKVINKNKRHRIFVAIDKQRDIVVGTATIFIEPKFIHNFGFEAHVEDVVVHVDYMGQGIGRALMERLLREAKKAQCYRMLLDCADKNVPFYEKLGFTKRGNEMIMDLH